MRLFVDTETTGLPRRRNAPFSDVDNWPRLVQLAWVLIDNAGREVAAHEYIIKPNGFTIPADAARIHGITTEIALSRGVPITQVLAEFGVALTQSRVLIAHNVDFDRPVLEAEHIRHELRCEIGRCELVCTKELSTEYCALPGNYGYKWPTLDELHRKLFGTQMAAAHNALVDVRACIKCYFELVDRGVIRQTSDQSTGKVAERDNSEDTQELIDEVIVLAGEHEWFDTTFVESVAKQFEMRGYLTDKQVSALQKIQKMLLSR